MSATQIIGSRIKELRTSKKITQSELAMQLNVPRQIISYYETGTRVPNIDDLAIIAKFFSVSSDYLLGLTDSMSTDITEREISDLTGIKECNLAVLLSLNKGSKDILSFIDNEKPVEGFEAEYTNIKYYAMRQKCIVDLINYLLQSSVPYGNNIAKHIVSYKYNLVQSNKAGRKALEALPALDPGALYDIYTRIDKFNSVVYPETFHYLNGKDDQEEQTECLRNVLRAEEQQRAAKYELFELIEEVRTVINTLYEVEERENERILNEIRAAYHKVLDRKAAETLSRNKTAEQEESPNK